MKRVIILIFVMSSVLLLITPMAQAAPITFNFTGNVTSVDSALSGTFSVGQSFSGSYTFESTTPMVNDLYEAITDFTFQVGIYTGSMAPGAHVIAVMNDTGTPNFDTYSAGTPFSGATVSGYLPLGAYLLLRDSTQSALSNTSLPTVPPDLSLFDVKEFVVVFEYNSVFPADVAGNVTSLTLGSAPIPEPSTMLLIGSGLVGLLGYGRRRLKK